MEGLASCLATLACLALTALFFASTAHATMIVYYPNNLQNVVYAINGITIDGTAYNVTFGADTYDSTFIGNAAGARDAVNAIDAALNTTEADYLYEYPPHGADVATSIYTVLVNKYPYGISASCSGIPKHWAIVPVTDYFGTTAQFQVTPEPGTALLVALGLLCLTGLHRKFQGQIHIA